MSSLRGLAIAVVASLTLVGATVAQEKTLTLPWDADWVTAVAFAGPEKKLISGNKLGQILLWTVKGDLSEATPVRRLDGHTNQITGLAVTPDGRWLVSASLDHTVRIWDFSAAAKGKTTICLRANSKKKTKADDFEVGTQDADKTLTAHTEWIRSLALSPDGKVCLTGDDLGTAILWQIPEGKEIKRLTTKGWLQGVALSPDSKQAVTAAMAPRRADFPSTNWLWDLGSGKMTSDLGQAVQKAKGAAGTIGMVSASYSADGKTVALGQDGEMDGGVGKVFLLDAKAGKKLHEIAAHPGGVVFVAFSPDGKLLATSGRDTTVRIWQTNDAKKVGELGKARGGQFRDWIHMAAWSHDAAWIAAADMAGFIHLYKR